LTLVFQYFNLKLNNDIKIRQLKFFLNDLKLNKKSEFNTAKSDNSTRSDSFSYEIIFVKIIHCIDSPKIGIRHQAVDYWKSIIIKVVTKV